MADLKWLKGYSGQTTDELIALGSEYRIDSVVIAFELALSQKEFRNGANSLTGEERTVLAVEALEREVNNGGYSQFFANSSNEYAVSIVESLERIGCPGTAEVTKRAISALNLKDIASAELEACDNLYYQTAEPIAGQLFAFIKANRTAIRL